MRKTDRRIRRTEKALHDALISLALQKSYDSITIQEILNRADIGRSTFYSHFDGKDELLVSGMENLQETLNATVERQRAALKRHEIIIGFSEAMFQHANEHRNVYYSLLHTSAWPVVRNRLQEFLDGLIRRECKTEIAKIERAESEVPGRSVRALPHGKFLRRLDVVAGSAEPAQARGDKRNLSLSGIPHDQCRSQPVTCQRHSDNGQPWTMPRETARDRAHSELKAHLALSIRPYEAI